MHASSSRAKDMTVDEVLQLIQERPADAELFQQLGGLCLGEGKLDEARQAYERAIEIDPQDPFSHLFLGNVLKALKRNHSAVASFQTAAELLPGDAIAHICLGDAYARIGRLDLSQQAFQTAARVSPDNLQAQKRIAEWNSCLKGTSKQTREIILSAYENDQAATVIALAPRWLANHPDDVLVIYNFAEMLYQTTKYDEAKNILLNAITRFEKSRWIFYGQLGSLCRYRGDFMGAEEWYQKVIDSRPEDAGGYIYLGAVQARQGRLHEAEASHRRGTQCPEGAIDEAYQNLGLVLRGQGRLLEAAECFRKALELDAEYYDAIEALHDVESAISLVDGD